MKTENEEARIAANLEYWNGVNLSIGDIQKLAKFFANAFENRVKEAKREVIEEIEKYVSEHYAYETLNAGLEDLLTELKEKLV